VRGCAGGARKEKGKGALQVHETPAARIRKNYFVLYSKKEHHDAEKEGKDGMSLNAKAGRETEDGMVSRKERRKDAVGDRGRPEREDIAKKGRARV